MSEPEIRRTWREQPYYKCQGCYMIIPDSEFLVAGDPFKKGEVVYGCPECGDMDSDPVCDREGCRRSATCGTPTPDGYRTTCGPHQPGQERTDV